MKEQLIQYVSLLFAGTQNCEDMKQEILQNTLDRYDDLISQGKAPEAAYRLSIMGIGDLSEILCSRPSAQAPVSVAPVSPPEPEDAANRKRRNRAIAIGMYIVSMIPLIALSELGLDIPVCGMVKDDFHRTRAIFFDEEEIAIDKHSEAFHLVTRVQDEAHRFAIEYHRSLRSKTQVRSILDDISGIGETRRKALMRYFGDIQKIREASVEELKQVPSMNEAAAQSVYRFFRQEPTD